MYRFFACWVDFKLDEDLADQPHAAEDLAADLLSRYHNSTREDHQHLCAAVGVMSQTLKDKEGIRRRSFTMEGIRRRPPKPRTRVSAMEGIEMDGDILHTADQPHAAEDLAADLLSRYHNSTREDHQHLCAAVGTMSQTLKDKGVPLTPVGYFGAAASSLDHLSRDPASSADPAAALPLHRPPQSPPAVIRGNGAAVSDALIFGAAEALQGLICHCIDESLVKQGVDRIRLNPSGGARSSNPTIIGKICVTFEGFLHYQYEAVRDVTFQILSTAFSRIGESSFYLMAGTIRSLADMQKLSDDDFPHRKQLQECVGSSLAALGPETFLRILPLKLEEDISDVDVWLLPILKQYTVGARLSYFSQYILYNIRFIQQKSNQLEKDGRIVSARNLDGFVYSCGPN